MSPAALETDVDSLRLAFGLFTILPVKQGGEPPEPPTVRRAILLAPAIGLLIGLVAAGALFLTRMAVDSSFTGRSVGDSLALLTSAVVGVIVLEILSGALHMDGLADSADGLASRGDKEQTLDVMRDPTVGAAGALAIVFVVLLDVVALAVCVGRGHGTEALITATVAGRVAVVWGCTLAAARDDGLGAWVSRCVRRWAAVMVTILSLAVPLLLALIDDDARSRATAFALAAIPFGLIVAAVGTAALRRRIGGITGDVLGAMSQLATTGALLVIACSP